MAAESESEINGRLQRCLSTPSLSSTDAKRCYDSPDAILGGISSRIQANLGNVSICFRKTVCTCKSPDCCSCDSDESADITAAHFTCHSNCRYTIELKTTKSIAPPPNGYMLRVFLLLTDQTELPLIDIRAPHWVTQHPPPAEPKPNSKSKGESKSKASEFGEDAALAGSVAVYGASDSSATHFNLIDPPFLGHHSLLVAFDYMSFSHNKPK